MERDFFKKLTKIIDENLSNELFGVSELSAEIGMSRSNLLRKVKKETGLSVSQYIRSIRLERSMDLLLKSDSTVSEIADLVGFSSTSYFIKCFGDEYGYPPGEALERQSQKRTSTNDRKHQLVAIMFTDIEGYTAMMQQDEDKALQFRERHRKVFEQTTEKYHGRILQYYGDGTLSTFESAIEAVRCGIEMQLLFGEDQIIPVRIGIHSGDILFSEDGIAGDGVNIASRIESLAVPRSVCISEKVFDEVKNQAKIEAVSLGIYELKNVEKPVEVYAISNPGLTIPKADQLQGKAKPIHHEVVEGVTPVTSKKKNLSWFLMPILVIILGYFIFSTDILRSLGTSEVDKEPAKKSIAVLPFINDSSDSSNIYIINGLMESTLNNLQKIGELRVISRTSVEKYRRYPKAIREIGKELDVQYIIEGSGQKIGDQILLNIQLIDARNDQHLWSEQYQRQTTDIFSLQRSIAQSITEQIEVIITPQEAEWINKRPTENLKAYDLFLQGLDLLNKTTNNYVRQSIPYFEQAIGLDDKFARAHAAIAIAYYRLDDNQQVRRFGEQINFHADKALLLDPQLPQSNIAKALYYMHRGDYPLAESFFEKSLEYNPNYDIAFVFLVDLYVHHMPDTEKYLEYALRGLQIDPSAYDSLIMSISYLHISNAFIQSGFVGEAERYVNRSLDYHPGNPYTERVRAFVVYARTGDLNATQKHLEKTLATDSIRIDLLQELGKIHYYKKEYEKAYRYYSEFLKIKRQWKLQIYESENAKIAAVLRHLGKIEDAESLLESFRNFAENDQSVYKDQWMSMYFSYIGETEKSIEHLQSFAEKEHYTYWTLNLNRIDPLFDNIREDPRFEDIFSAIEEKFWNYHDRIALNLSEKGLI